MTDPDPDLPGGGRRGADAADVERYLARVRTALDDLRPEQRDDLLEDLPGHLLEASADSGQPLERTLGAPQTYAADLRSSAGLPPRTSSRRVAGRFVLPAAQLADATARRARALGDQARTTSQGRAVLDFLPQLRPAWWVLRGYLVLAVPAALGIVVGIGVPPFLTLFGSDLLGLLAVLGAVVTSVRLGMRSDRLPHSQRQLVAVGNVAVVLLALLGGLALRERVSYDGGVVYAATESGYLQGPDGGISNLYAFDAQGLPLQDVQLFDQDGRPIDTLLLQAPDGSYAEPVRAVDEHGVEVRNVFPRTLVTETWGPDGQPSTAPVPPPAIVPRRLATASPTVSPTASPAVSPAVSPTASPTASPLTPTGTPTAVPRPTLTPAVAPTTAPAPPAVGTVPAR